MSVFMAEGWAGPPRIPSGCWAERVQTARSPGCTKCVATTGPGLHLQGPPYLSLSIAPQPERPWLTKRALYSTSSNIFTQVK